jgi:hypothetical protein
MPPLDPTLRKKLESTVVSARDAAEGAARATIRALAVHEKSLREPLRRPARQDHGPRN